MGKVKTSIYVDRDLWRRFKMYASKRDEEISRLLEEIIQDEIVDEILDEVLYELAGGEDHEVDFEPIKPRGGPVSAMVRVMRDERANGIS